MGNFWHGNDGVVTWDALGAAAGDAIAWDASGLEAALVDVGVFNAGTKEHLEVGTEKCRGTVTVKMRHDRAVAAFSTATLTLKSRSTLPYHQLSGTAILYRIPVSRSRGDEVDTVVFAFAMSAGDWVYEKVAA